MPKARGDPLLPPLPPRPSIGHGNNADADAEQLVPTLLRDMLSLVTNFGQRQRAMEGRKGSYRRLTGGAIEGNRVRSRTGCQMEIASP